MEPQPPETFGISYQILFTVRVLHRYFLNYGTTGFDTEPALPDTKKRLELIRQAYDVAQFWEILPDDETRLTLKNQRMLFKQQPDGFAVLVATENPGSLKPFLSLADGLKLVFAVYPTDSSFMVYTNLSATVMDDLKKTARVFRLKNKNATTDDVPNNNLTTGETIRAGDIENRTAGQSAGGRLQPPLGFIEIGHALPGLAMLIDRDHIYPIDNPLTFNLILQNRATEQLYKNDP